LADLQALPSLPTLMLELKSSKPVWPVQAGRAFARNKRNPTCGYAAHSTFFHMEDYADYIPAQAATSWRPESAAPAASTRRSDS
jgi:hypothetical protein